MNYRNEWKYLVSGADLVILGARLRVLLPNDSHQKGSGYAIRSLYFDDWQNSCLAENEAGVDNRRKFRIRIYNGSTERIQLEIKEKLHGMTHKSSCLITRQECEAIMAGIPPRITKDTPAPQNLLSIAMSTRGMEPKVIVEYERTAFVGRTGNVRITFDRNISAGNAVHRFLEPRVPLMPVLPTGQHVLEVKFDELLPDPIAQVLDLGRLQQTAFSKYYLCRTALPSRLAERAKEHEF